MVYDKGIHYMRMPFLIVLLFILSGLINSYIHFHFERISGNDSYIFSWKCTVIDILNF